MSSSNPEAQIFMLQEKTNLFLIDKNVLIVMISLLINKDVFDPSYNDLKFTVGKHNFCFVLCNLIMHLHAHSSTVYKSQDMEAI